MNLNELKNAVHDGNLDFNFIDSFLKESNIFCVEFGQYNKNSCFLSMLETLRFGNRCIPSCMRDCANGCSLSGTSSGVNACNPSCINGCSISSALN